MSVEEPSFHLFLQEGQFEVRDYPALVTAEVDVTGNRSSAATAGFRLLAAYIFGANTRKQSIAMTAPVMLAPPDGQSIAMTAPVTQSGDAALWTIRFVMPREWTLATLPTPTNARIHLSEQPPSRVAVVRFSGLAGEQDIRRHSTELAAFIARRALRPVGPAILARYNPPWTLWFLRRNEIMIPLRAATSSH
jgi:hypothetical protein